MKIVELTTIESETVERAFYEAQSYESLMAVLSRQLNANANPETTKILMHYAELCRAAQMKLKMAQDTVVSRYMQLNRVHKTLQILLLTALLVHLKVHPALPHQPQAHLLPKSVRKMLLRLQLQLKRVNLTH